MRMPDLPIEVDPATPITGRSLDDDEDASQHRRITADLRGGIACGAFQPGDLLPTLAEIARRYDVATSTVHRSFATLKGAGLIEVTRGKRAVVSPGVD
jgi:DNA-binding GntR family transcriptional regulator